MSQCCVIPHTGDTPTCPMNGQVKLGFEVPEEVVIVREKLLEEDSSE